MFVGGGTLFLFAAGFAIVFIRVAGQYAEDWQQMMIYELQIKFGFNWLDKKYSPAAGLNKSTPDPEKAQGRVNDSTPASTSLDEADDDRLKT